MSHFSRVRWRQTCLKMNPFSYIWDLEDGENSGSWLRGLRSLSKRKRVPNVQGTSQQENGAWENGHDCFKNIPDDLLWGHVWFQQVHWPSIYPLCSQHKDPQTQSRVLVSSQNLFWDTDQASFNDWENHSLSLPHTLFKYLKLFWLSAISWALGSISSARGAFIFEYLSDLNL